MFVEERNRKSNDGSVHQMLELIVEGTRAGEQHSSRTTEDISESD
jgi:hypothetical protein